MVKYLSFLILNKNTVIYKMHDHATINTEVHSLYIILLCGSHCTNTDREHENKLVKRNTDKQSFTYQVIKK